MPLARMIVGVDPLNDPATQLSKLLSPDFNSDKGSGSTARRWDSTFARLGVSRGVEGPPWYTVSLEGKGENPFPDWKKASRPFTPLQIRVLISTGKYTALGIQSGGDDGGRRGDGGWVSREMRQVGTCQTIWSLNGSVRFKCSGGIEEEAGNP